MANSIFQALSTYYFDFCGHLLFNSKQLEESKPNLYHRYGQSKQLQEIDF